MERGVVVLIAEGTVGEEVICGVGLQAEKTIKINKEIKRVLDLVSIFLSIQTRKTAQLEAAPCRRNYKGLSSCGVDFTRPFIERSSCPERYSGRWWSTGDRLRKHSTGLHNLSTLASHSIHNRPLYCQLISYQRSHDYKEFV